ncbi:hypothetical protein [Shewanella sp. YIC-542]|uniref:hypothetical protein n=1 Tax=Shewanella mytili TaxID=3377111 RepID=UPI00398F46D0
MGLLLDIQGKLPVQLHGLSKLSGVSALEKRRKLQRLRHSDKRLIGCWRDPRQNLNDDVLLYQHNGRWFMETWFSDGCHSLDEMTARDTADGVRLEELDGNLFGEYLLLQEGHALCFCNDNGSCVVASNQADDKAVNG